jgi:cytochrome c556
MNRAVGAVLMASVLAVAGDTPAPRLKEPSYLPPLARQLLKKRMARHGDEMMRLVMAVTLLERERVKALADDIAKEPRLVRPLPGGENDLNASLPEKLFVLQDQLRDRATALTEAASQPNDAALATALGKVTETCVACHSAYLNP